MKTWVIAIVFGTFLCQVIAGPKTNYKDFVAVSFFDITAATIKRLQRIDSEEGRDLASRLRHQYLVRVFLYWKLDQLGQNKDVEVAEPMIKYHAQSLKMHFWKELEDPLYLLVEPVPEYFLLPGYTRDEYIKDLPLFATFVRSLGRKDTE